MYQVGGFHRPMHSEPHDWDDEQLGWIENVKLDRRHFREGTVSVHASMQKFEFFEFRRGESETKIVCC